MCVGMSGCPSSVPATGEACNNVTGMVCDYPNTNPTLHFACMCTANTDASSGSTWTCVQSAPCAVTQPSYSLSNTCSGASLCTYSDSPNYCACRADAPWVCGPEFTVPGLL
jgi:hypothetical protein